MQIGVGGRLERIGLMEAELAHFQIDCALVTDFTQRDEEVLPRKVRVLKGGDMQIVFGVVAVQVIGKKGKTLLISYSKTVLHARKNAPGYAGAFGYAFFCSTERYLASTASPKADLSYVAAISSLLLQAPASQL